MSSRKEQESELRRDVRITHTEYLALAEQHELLLGYAHRAPHGSSAILGALHRANELGPQVMLALRQYLDAVEILTVFYSANACSTATRSRHKSTPAATYCNFTN
jgi:hypothetical protein